MTDPSTPGRIVKYSEEWWATRSPEVRSRRCHAKNGNGDQCGKVAMEAQRVCGTHGGRAPAAKLAARRRLDEASDRMVKQLLGIAESAESEAVKLAAVKDVLDRAMGKATTTVEVSAKPAWEEVMNDIVGVAQITRAESRARQRLTPEPPALVGSEPMEVVDAELVDEPEHGPRGRTPADRPDDPTDPDASRSGPPSRPPGRELATLEDATADTAAANRAAARLGRVRRMR